VTLLEYVQYVSACDCACNVQCSAVHESTICQLCTGANVAGVYEQELELQPIAYINRTQQIGSAAAVMGVVTSPGELVS